MRRTKIVCTIGPASQEEDILREIIKSGMNVARFNFSHGDHEEHGRKLERVRRISRELHLPVAVLLDTRGPEIRLCDFENGKVELVEGQKFTLTTEDILGTSDYGKEQAQIEKLGENHVYFLPYLMGERSPHNDPDARGTFIGMTMDTTRADMTQAVLEGVAFALRDSFEVARSLGISIERTKICGGGAKSPLWKKIIANVMNIKVDVPESEEGPGYGGAILAAVACGEYASVAEAAEKLVKVVDTVEPDPELAEKYEARYAQFKQIYPAVKALFPKLK